ncbi:MAG: glycosyltransferase [Chitinispirillaceae bacterium]|nr:glycosyltransferase [Chitinispirillaceae bacterium]
MTRISIVIPTLNRTLLLERCLTSISREVGDAPDVEVIVVDDGSTTAAVEKNRSICTRHHARLLTPGGNHGMAVARNHGISSARGEWVIFLDDDVAVDPFWYRRLCHTLQLLPPEVVGFEGKINSSGNGVWDREVSNQSGGAYLTSHLGVRKSMLEQCGGFDPAFEFKGPFCEDQELAARLLSWGEVPFVAEISVTHAPRGVKLLSYLLTAPKRSRQLLLAEHYFFHKHPDRYHCFRSHRTFWGTMRSVMFRNIINDLRRRLPETLLLHPLQTVTLVLGSLIGQAASWMLLPRLVLGKLPPQSTFGSCIDSRRTTELWRLPVDRIDMLYVDRRPFATLFFTLLHRPTHDIRTTIRRLGRRAKNRQCDLFLRIDDLFLSDGADVRKLCDLLEQHHCPFLAAVTGNDLLNTAYRTVIGRVREAGGTIGVHGFSHTGKFGPFPSELLQMRYPELQSKVESISSSILFEKEHTLILVPPFNAIGPGQIVQLSRLFKIICGGPETLRFTGRILGPVALDGGGWYFPSLHPFYGSAESILRSGSIKFLQKVYGPVCMTTHFPCEAADAFRSLSRLLASLPFRTQPWHRLF